MSYDKTTWVNDVTAVSTNNMNHIENGIKDAHDILDGIFDAIYPVGSIYMSASLSTHEQVEALFGGTWVAWGAGRVPVGVDTSQTEFDTVEETGGAKTVTLTAAQSGVPAHNHGLNSHTHTYNKANSPTGSTTLTASQIPSHRHSMASTSSNITYASGSKTAKVPVNNSGGNTGYTGGGDGHTHTIGTTSTNTGGASGNTANNTAANASSAHTNLQPYITCYMYKRIA